MNFIFTVLITLATLGILVAIHEYGHFWVARKCGVKVLKFSIGFGPSLWSWHDKLGTEYSISAIPLGGFVKMLDERESEVSVEEQDQAFNRKPVLQRIAVVIAGPAANFLLAIVAYWCLFMAGETGYAPIVGGVEAGSAAEMAGIEAGQEIVAIDGEPTPTWQAVSLRLLDHLGETGTVAVATRYSDSDMIYETALPIEQWLATEENPDIFDSLGIRMYVPEIPPIVDQVVDGSPANQAGILAGDRVITADGTAIEKWSEWVDYVRARPEQAISIEVQRGEGLRTLTVTPGTVDDESGNPIGQVGITVALPELPEELLRSFERGPIESLFASLSYTGQISMFTLSSIKKMVEGLISPKNLSGPITIAKIATASAKSGLEPYIRFLALLSISLGVLNLLPIPVLDGGHLLFYTIEWLIGRPVPERIQSISFQFGLVLVLAIMSLAVYNDFARL